MKITDISIQAKNSNRVNVFVDGKYKLSLDVFQISNLGIRVGKEYTEDELAELESESQFGKLYARTLEFIMLRPHSAREVHDYLWKKTLSKKYKSKSGEVKAKEGVSKEISERVFGRLSEKGYIDDEKFARFWVENRNQRKGTSIRKLRAELSAKGVESSIVESVLEKSERSDTEELKKILQKKRAKYDDNKLIQYLARQGFRYDDIKRAIEEAAQEN